jgi:hypothetical protein
MKRQWVIWMIVALGLTAPVLSRADRHGSGQPHAQAERARQQRPPRLPDYDRPSQHRNLGAGLTPEQRRELRRDVDQAGRQLYRKSGRGNRMR